MLAAVTGVGAWTVGGHDAARQDEQRREAAGVVAARFEARTAALVRSVELDPSLSPPTSRAVLAIERVTTTGVTQRLWPRGAARAATVISTDTRVAMELARDLGRPQAGAPSADTVVIAVAEYADLSADFDTDTRRMKATGWRLATVVPARLLDDITLPPGDAVRVLLAEESVAADVSSVSLVAGQPWQLAVDIPDAHRFSMGAVVLLGTGLLGALLLLVLGIRFRGAIEQSRQATLALERETRTVAELGPLLQSSLDLAQVLPAVAIRLSDEFGLSRLAVQLHGDDGRLVDVFALGGRAGAPEDELTVTTATDDLPAGVAASLPLLRAGRTIGRLSFSARRPMQQAQIAALSAAADLIAVATYNVELYEREQASVRRLRDLDQLKDAFLGTISHELRTPITAIGGFVRLLRDRWDQVTEAQRLEFLDRVHRNSLSLGLLVDDLLDFARLERQALNAPASPIQLDTAVSSIVAQLGPVLGDREITVESQPVRALANSGALERVLANLLTNANKFSPPDRRIVVRVRNQAASATVEVLDEGPGIAAEDREHVFTRFYRGDSNAARGTRGAGIGLSVVRELVKQMGGTVAALPNFPSGTRMVVNLALEPAASPGSDVPEQGRRIELAPPAVERSGT